MRRHGRGRRGGWLCAGVLVVGGCAGSESSEPEVLLPLVDVAPGETVGLLASEDDDTRYVEWLNRVDGAVRRVDIDADDINIETMANIDVGTIDDDQRGLLGQAAIGDRRFVSWTRPESFELDVGELFDDGSLRVIWTAGESGDGAIGGVLQTTDSELLLLGLGRNTAWDAQDGIGGALLALDPDGDIDQTESIISTGYTNPWAFVSVDGPGAIGEVWVADNAAGPDPDDETRDDVERIGRADLVTDRNEMDEVDWPGRAPSAMVELSDGRLGICGFLDNELRAYEIVAGSDPQRPRLERAGTIMPCLSGAAVFADGTIVTVAQTDDGMALHILRS